MTITTDSYRDPVSGATGSWDYVQMRRQEVLGEFTSEHAEEAANAEWDEDAELWRLHDGSTMSDEDMYWELVGKHRRADIHAIDRIDHLIAQHAEYSELEAADDDDIGTLWDSEFAAEHGRILRRVDGALLRLTDTSDPSYRSIPTNVEGLRYVLGPDADPASLSNHPDTLAALRDMRSRNSRTWQRLVAGEIDLDEALRIDGIVRDRHDNTRYDAMLQAGWSREEARAAIREQS